VSDPFADLDPDVAATLNVIIAFRLEQASRRAGAAAGTEDEPATEDAAQAQR
jgi:hypothetical protein